MSRHLFAAASTAALFVAFGSSAAFAQSTPMQPRIPPVPGRIALPDLTFRVTWLQLPGSPVRVKSVHNGRPYLACFVVVNIGVVPSGPFRVSGGGLGLPTNPYQDHASLAPGASRQGCLTYPTTPPPGHYNLGLTVDSQHVVHESREDNNDAVIYVPVAP
jgi:hypothetical protein